MTMDFPSLLSSQNQYSFWKTNSPSIPSSHSHPFGAFTYIPSKVGQRPQDFAPLLMLVRPQASFRDRTVSSSSAHGQLTVSVLQMLLICLYMRLNQHKQWQPWTLPELHNSHRMFAHSLFHCITIVLSSVSQRSNVRILKLWRRGLHKHNIKNYIFASVPLLLKKI